ncbi:MAG TPA: hypothetical protein VFS04_13730 [Alphaproteobacteria bacterium]|nr:hypothetical protein [Alphaproteobacteria bacterium]
MIAKTTLTAAALAASLIAIPAFAQNAAPNAAAPAAGQLPTTLNPQANQAINGIRGQWEQARNALLQARNAANGARQAAARAEQAEFQALQNFERANTALINVMAAAAGRPPVTGALANLPPELPPPNVPQGQPAQGQPPQPPAGAGAKP